MSGSRSWPRRIALGCGGALAVLVVFVVVVFTIVRMATAGPEDVARTFLTAAAAGSYDSAHAAFAAPLKTAQPLDVFTAAVKGNPTLFAVKDLSFSDRSIDLSGATLVGTATLTSGTEVPISFSFARENDTWKILAYHVGSKD